MILVSAGADGNPALGGHSCSGVISADGRYVAFASAATNLLVGQVSGSINIFRRDLQTGTTLLVSVSANGIDTANGDCSDPVISSDGRYVTFLSSAKNLAVGTPSGVNTFWRDINSGSTTMLNGSGASSYTYHFLPSMSANGRYVAYLRSSLKVRDTQLGVDVYTDITGATSAALSPDGTRLLYGNGSSIYVRDLINGTNIVWFSSSVPIQNSRHWSGDGRFFAFVSSTNLILGDNNTNNKVYLCDLQTRAVTVVSVNFAHTGAASGVSDMPAVSGDGRFVVYRSFATDLVPWDFNPAPKVYLFDRLTVLNAVLSPAQTDSSPFPWISMPAISAGGESVVFLSVGSGLVEGDLNRMPDAFATGADSDADGIPDWWMLQYFGHAVGQAGDLSRAQDDADSDGTSNLQEYLSGTNPTSATSDFSIQIFPVISFGNTVTLTWPAVPAMSYRVQYKNNLNDPQWQDLPGSAPVFGNRAYFAVPPDQASRFFRIVGSG